MTNSEDHAETFRRIKEVRAQAIEHTRLARQLAVERRDLVQGLLDDGLSQSDIARELGVSRQAQRCVGEFRHSLVEIHPCHEVELLSGPVR